MSFIKNNNVQTEYKTTYYVGAPYAVNIEKNGNGEVIGYDVNEQLNVVNAGTKSYAAGT